MKLMLKILIVFWMVMGAFAQCDSQENKPVPLQARQEFTLITYNIYRDYFTRNDPASPLSWSKRKEGMISLLEAYKPDILCMQEDDWIQGEDIRQVLNFNKVGVSRYTASEEVTEKSKLGDYMGIYYNPKRFRVLDKGYFFFSETPDIPSKSWDADATSLCNWTKMEDLNRKITFYIFNTHLDYIGAQTRMHSVQILKERIPNIVKDSPIILTGDMNDSENSAPLQYLKTFLKDSYKESVQAPAGPYGTFNDFKPDYDLAKYKFDYILVGGKVSVLNYKVIDEKRNGNFPSDHLPVFCNLKL